jgi:hypothetical protein
MVFPFIPEPDILHLFSFRARFGLRATTSGLVANGEYHDGTKLSTLRQTASGLDMIMRPQA